jgi:hypothetical protein
MQPLAHLASILGLSFVSGVNLYLGVLVTGLCVRYNWVTGLPGELSILGHPAVLVAAGLFYALEFFADKIPFVTVIWDFIHTVVRPVGGALLSLAAAGDLPPVVQVLATLVGGTIALSTHGTKMGFRLAAHAAPEPATHAAISVAEDVGVVGLLMLAYSHPVIASIVIVILLGLMAFIIPRIFRTLRFLLASLYGRVRSWFSAASQAEIPVWVLEKALGVDPTGKATALEAYARSVKGAPKLADGFLVRSGQRWHFVFRGLFRSKIVDLDEGRLEPLRTDSGWFYDTLHFAKEGKVMSFYVTKDWSSAEAGLLDGQGLASAR